MNSIISRLWKWFLHPPLTAPRATVLIRLMVGAVFLWEGIGKFVFDSLGVKRFALIGIPAPGLLSPFDGVTEIVCGILIMLGLVTRFAAMPMIIDMVVAITTTKIPLFLGTSSLPPAPVPPQAGFAAVLNEVTSEFPQLLGSIFLLIHGAGRWSVDALRARAWGAVSEREQSGERPRAAGSSSALKRLVDWLLHLPLAHRRRYS